METYDTIICGAGPAGLAAALASVQCGQKTLLLEKMAVTGTKLLASGGGRCNFSNTLPDRNFMEAFGREGRFMTDALRVGGRDFLLGFLHKHGIREEIVDGLYYFPKEARSADIRNAFLYAATGMGLEVRTRCRVLSLIVQNNILTGIQTNTGEIGCSRFILAAGGTAMSTLGGCDHGLKLAESAGHTVSAPLPAMAPILLRDKWIPNLSGVSLPRTELTFKCGKQKQSETGALLFTHEGLSGPAALNLSGPLYRAWDECKKKSAFSLKVNFLPGRTMADVTAMIDRFRKEDPVKLLRSSISTLLPHSLANVLVSLAGLDDAKNQTVKNQQRDQIACILTGCPLDVGCLCPMEKAMAMSGGIKLKEVNPKTMESRLVKGLYFAGEILDLTGPCGGFNIQFAIASGTLAGTIHNERSRMDIGSII